MITGTERTRAAPYSLGLVASSLCVIPRRLVSRSRRDAADDGL